MRNKLIVLSLLIAGGLFVYFNQEAVRAHTAPVVTTLFNVAPVSLQRLLFSTHLPSDYPGVYLADPSANAAWARRQQYVSQPQPTGRRQVELRPDCIVSHAHAATIIEPIAVVQRGGDFVVVEYLDRGGETRIEKDDAGIWIAFEESAPGYKERYRRLK